MNKLKVIQLGVGDFGKSWIDILTRSGHVDLVGVISRNTSGYDELMHRTGLERSRIYPDLGTALREADLDLLLNVTPPAIHRDTCSIALKGGVHVLCEKPAGESWADVQAMLDTADAAGKQLIIAENYRYFPVVRRAAALIRSGAVGRVRRVEIRFLRRHEMDNYHGKLRHPLLLDVAVHHFDCLRALTGLEAEEVLCTSPAADSSAPCKSAGVKFRLAGGAEADYTGSLEAAQSETGWLGEWIIRGETGTLTLSEGRLALDTGDGPQVEEFPPEDGRGELLADAVTAIQSGAAAPTDLRDNRKSFALSLAAIRSLEQNSPVDLLEDGIFSMDS